MTRPDLSTLPQRLAPRGSIYLASALMVLLGSYLTLHPPGQPVINDLGAVFRTHLAYECALLMVLAFLHRRRDELSDTLTVAAILAVFVIDGLLTSQLYDWENGAGQQAAVLGTVSGLALLAGATVALGLSLHSRLVVTVTATVLFTRFAPALLLAASSADVIEPRYTAIGFLLAALTLPTLLLRPARSGGARLPLAAMERWGIAGCLAIAVLHFVAAGAAFDVPFLPDYLAPFVILLAPAIEALVPAAVRSRPVRLAVTGIPWVGLALSALHFPAGILDTSWARAWPLTPFYLCLLLVAMIQVHRSAYWAAAAIAAVACLGGDPAEIMTRTVFPHTWQLLAVSAVIWSAIASARSVRVGLALQGVPALLAASWLSERGYPWLVAYAAAFAAGVLTLRVLTGWALPRTGRLAAAAVLCGGPVLAWLGDHGSRLHLAVAAGACVLAVALALLCDDRLLRQLAAAAAAAGLVGWVVAFQYRGDVTIGVLLTQVGFLLLLVAFLRSISGSWLREQWESAWEGDEAAAPLHRQSTS